MESPPAALGLDLGSTRLKAGLLAADGSIDRLVSGEVPALARDGDRCEGDATAYVDAALGLLDELAAGIEDGLPAGLSCQRSSFVLLEPGGRPMTPMISWQDTRAADWCRRHAGFEAEFHRLTGLMLSAHYIGPKLAAMSETDSGLRQALGEGRLRLRTLDALLIERLGGTASTDPSMAARSGLFDIENLGWSTELCAAFGVHPDCLPEVRPSDALDAATPQGARFRTSLADQSAGLVGLTGADADTVLVNLGTGGFVLRPIDEPSARLPGYLTGILRADRAAPALYALEGAISGCGPAIDRYREATAVLEPGDPAPDLFAIPDGAGLGAPHWRPDLGLTFSLAETEIGPDAARRALLEGLLFRVRELFDGMSARERVRRVALAGGLSSDPFVPRGLAALLERPVERIDATEVTLRGAALAAGGETQAAAPAASRYEPQAAGSYLRSKYGRWRNWLGGLLR